MEDRCNKSPNHCNKSGVHLDVLNSPLLNNSRLLSPKHYSGLKSLDQQKDDLLRQQDLKIKSLKRSLKSYQKSIEIQNAKISSQDTLFIEFNTLNKNLSELETELNQYKCETIRLNEILQNKNQTINEFQNLIEISTDKFNQFEDTNTSLKRQLEQCESKLKVIPSLSTLNENLQGKIRLLEVQIVSMKNEQNNKEDAHKEIIATIEKNEQCKVFQVKQLENDINNHKMTIERLNADNDKLNHLYRDIQACCIEKDNTFKHKLDEKEKELNKMSKKLSLLDQNLKEVDHNYTNQLSLNKDTYNKLSQDYDRLSNELKMEKDHTNKLNEQLRDMENIIHQSDYNLQLKDDHIKRLNEQNDQLSKQLNDSQLNIIELEHLIKNETDILNKRLILSEKERNGLLSDKDSSKKDIASLKETIVQLERNANEHLIDCHEVDGKYNELLKVMELKEDEYCREFERCMSEMKRKENEVEEVREKKDKKIQLLKLSNEELEARVKNLINTLISLREYAIDIEKNLYTNQLRTIHNNNNSLGSTTGSLNNTYKDENEQKSYSKQLINGLKDIITKIDTKIASSDNNKGISSICINNNNSNDNEVNSMTYEYQYQSYN